ncbi:MAG TPA: MFS transporter [Polyangiaceae bacterium]|jgi:AAA family ATP:ADP antiporter|nr:MFS transporter [Polyangiaceae bacterium]
MRIWPLSLIDVRAGEFPQALRAFLGFFLITAAHSGTETVRDSLLVTRLPANSWGFVYLIAAGTALLGTAAAGSVMNRYGQRITLCASLLLVSLALLGVNFAGGTSGCVFGIYVVTSFVSAVAIPAFWSQLGGLFTLTQGRRLYGLIASGGALGAASGSYAALELLRVMPIRGALVIAAATFVLAALVFFGDSTDERQTLDADAPALDLLGVRTLRREPLLRRLAIVIVLSSVVGMIVDYFFKWTISRQIPAGHVVAFVARYYAILNALGFGAQVFVSSSLISRLGVIATLAAAPVLLLGGTVGALAFPNQLLPLLVIRGFDSILRSSLTRVGFELAYLPVPLNVRRSVKPFVDGLLVRVAQAIMGILLLIAASEGWLSARAFQLALIVLMSAWLLAALRARRSYLEQLRRGLTTGEIEPSSGADPLDLESAAVLIQLLSADNPELVRGAINALVRRERQHLIPALILYHSDADVLVSALSVVAEPGRDDWVTLTRKLLRDERYRVRTAAAHALARSGQLEPSELSADPSARVRGYATMLVALFDRQRPPSLAPKVVALLMSNTEESSELRLGALSAFGDVPPRSDALNLLEELCGDLGASAEWTEAVANAISAQAAHSVTDLLIERMVDRDGREPIRRAFVQLGSPAFERLATILDDERYSRAVRLQVPAALSAFPTRKAADRLLDTVENTRDGLLRYRAVRALGRLAAQASFRISRTRIEALSLRNLIEYFRLLALRVAFESAPTSEANAVTRELILGLLSDKLAQSLERCFRLLKIAHADEDLHRVYRVLLSGSPHARANARELLETMLSRRDQLTLRDLLRLVADDISDRDRLVRASTRVDLARVLDAARALELLRQEADPTLTALAEHHAAVSGEPAPSSGHSSAVNLSNGGQPTRSRSGPSFSDS